MSICSKRINMTFLEATYLVIRSIVEGSVYPENILAEKRILIIARR